MSSDGHITRWNDDRGFGFIAPAAGGDQPFVHISAFVNRGRRPRDGDPVTYVLKRDSKGRTQAVQVKFAGDAARLRPGNQPIVRAMLLAATFLLILGGSALVGLLPPVLFLGFATMSCLAFLIYGADKSASRKGGWRTRESTLHLLGLAGGWPGALVAMQVFRHKSRKQSFRVVFWATVLVNCVVLAWLATPAGANFLKSILAQV